MRVLAVSDVESRSYYDYYTPGKLDGFDLIISCGDLLPTYLEFLVTMAGCPLLYVHGNHDGIYDEDPPGGCECIDGRLMVIEGVRVMGLGGSLRYGPGPHRYTERQMARRMRRVMPSVWAHGGVDVLVTHAPARGINDTDALAHRGFACFNRFLARHPPRYFVHGHMHRNYGMHVPQKTARGSTMILNAFDHVTFEV
ncbi:MAG: metallophosphoesterase family protein [Acidobacteriota bacterium]|nr:metallophosphoesterase family protein [Acidobacteriota bacterium]